jgi:hypothetical protein
MSWPMLMRAMHVSWFVFDMLRRESDEAAAE